MATLLFPRKIPDTATLYDLIHHSRDFELGANREILIYPGTKSQVVLPHQYQIHMGRFLWRETILRLILRFGDQIDIAKERRDNLTMILQYMDNVFNCISEEGTGLQGTETDFRSKTFDEYLVIEYYVGCHEPFEIRDFRRRFDINLNWMRVEECDWRKYLNAVGTLWSGDRNRFKLPAHAQTLKAATMMLECCNRLNPTCVIPDPYFGYTYHEHEGSSEEDSDTQSDDESKNIPMVSATQGSQNMKGAIQRVSKKVEKTTKVTEKKRKGMAPAKMEKITRATVTTHCMVTRSSQRKNETSEEIMVNSE